MLELVYMSIKELNDSERALLYSCIAPERQEQLKMRKNQASADQSLVAEGLARVMLCQSVRGVQAKDFVISRDGNGKPYQGTIPGLYFNYSHSGSLVACAVADTEVGVDIQKVSENAKVRERIFCPQELEENACFTEIWAKKESYLKLTGEGLRREMSTLCVRKMQEDGEADWFGGPVCDEYYLYACVSGDAGARKNGWKMYEMTLQEVLKTL